MTLFIAASDMAVASDPSSANIRPDSLLVKYFSAQRSLNASHIEFILSQ